jgi:hypothetical protein
MEVTGLNSEVTYYFLVRTQTDPHAKNQNEVVSEDTEEISATTAKRHTISVSSGGGGCFIATAAYGSRMAEQAKVLKELRDRVLLTKSLVGVLVKAYYKVSPTLADFSAKHDNSRAAFRRSLLPLVGMSCVALKIGTVPTVALVLLLILLLGVTAPVIFKRKKVVKVIGTNEAGSISENSL